MSTFRYILSSTVTENLNEIAIKYKDLSCGEFKSIWDNWLDCNKELISDEKQRLTKEGYTGNLELKMYKSCRYYLTKKQISKQPKIRRKYTSCNKSFIKMIDNHIKIQGNNISPSIGLKSFIDDNPRIWEEEILYLYDSLKANNSILEKIEVLEKMKKTFKNRYFLIYKK
jgi:hypothetical protein